MLNIDLVAHPIRHRIVSALAGRELSTEQIGQLIDDVPHATLYRQIGVLVDGGLVQITGHRRHRGRSIRILALIDGAGLLNRKNIDAASPEQNARLVNSFLTNLMATYASAARAPGAKPGDWRLAGYHAYLTEKEEHALADQIHALLTQACADKPGPGRRRRLVTFGVLPDRDFPVARSTVRPTHKTTERKKESKQ